MNIAPAEHITDADAQGVEFLLAEDGHAIPLRHWPVEHPKALIHIAHGMSEHSGLYADAAAIFNAAGYAVMAHDHRCHGLSVPITALGETSEHQHWEAVCADMRSVNSHGKSVYPDVPWILLGHSMGSFISLSFAERHSQLIDLLVLQGTNYEAPWFTWAAHWFASFECWRQGENARSPIIHALTFGKFARAFKSGTEYDWLSRDANFVQRYLNDPRCGVTCTNGFWRDLLEGLSRTQRMTNLRKIRKDLPIYSFAGAKDPVGKEGVTVAILDDKLEAAGMRDVTLKIYEDARHDLFHETNSAEVMSDLIRWLDETLARVAQPACALKPAQEPAAWLAGSA